MKIITSQDLMTMIIQGNKMLDIWFFNPERQGNKNCIVLYPVTTSMSLTEIMDKKVIIVDMSNKKEKEEPTSEDDSLLSAKALDFLSRKAYRNSSNEERIGLIKLAKTLYPGG